MLERTAALEALGVTRRAGVWTRLISHALALSRAGLARAGAVPRAGRRRRRCGPSTATATRPRCWPRSAHRRGYPHAGELVAHLEALVARSRGVKPRHLESLLPRLQAECATPQPLADLKAACTRAQDRWEHRVAELDTLEGPEQRTRLPGLPRHLPRRRAELQRTVTLYVGPPNSGKTHAAFERLAQALDGAYLAPLRLLALEGPRPAGGARRAVLAAHRRGERAGATTRAWSRSTIEMVDTNKPDRRGGDRRSADDLRHLARLGLDAGHRRRCRPTR